MQVGQHWPGIISGWLPGPQAMPGHGMSKQPGTHWKQQPLGSGTIIEPGGQSMAGHAQPPPLDVVPATGNEPATPVPPVAKPPVVGAPPRPGPPPLLGRPPRLPAAPVLVA